MTEFLGIKYAEAAVGELRFAAPKRYIALPGTVYYASDWVSERHLPRNASMIIENHSHRAYHNGQLAYICVLMTAQRLSLQQAARQQIPQLH